MLVELIKHIERALVSYIKIIEREQSHLILNEDFACLIASTRRLSDFRQKDVLTIYSFCKQAINQDWPVQQCVMEVYQYVMSMRSGFWFFTGNSKLRFCVIQAIEHYDMRYIRWQSGKPILVEHIYQVQVNDSLKSASPQDRLYEDNAISQLVQGQLDDLKAQTLSQQHMMHQHDATFEDMTDVVRDLKRILNETRQELVLMKMENIELHKKINQFGGQASATVDIPVTVSVVETVDEEEQKRITAVC